MIFDRLEKLVGYQPRFKAAYDFIKSCRPETPEGMTRLGDSGLYAKVESYATRLPEEGLIEAHLKYIDIQACLTGAEGIEFFRDSDLELTSRDPDKDLVLYTLKTRPAGQVAVFPGDFAVFFPREAHRPRLIAGPRPELIKKVVVKVPYSCLS